MSAGDIPRTRPTTTYWQHLLDGWPDGTAPQPPYHFDFPVRLPDGRVLLLPLRALPGGDRAVASLIANHASFAVVAALAGHMADLARSAGVDLVVGLPTLGLTFAGLVAERLGHERYVPFGYSRKFWYDDALSEPIFSITSPAARSNSISIRNVVPLLKGKRICLMDDAISTGSSTLASHRLLARLGVQIAAVVVAMKQTTRWQVPLGTASPALRNSVRAVFGSPLFAGSPEGWRPIEGTLPEVP